MAADTPAGSSYTPYQMEHPYLSELGLLGHAIQSVKDAPGKAVSYVSNTLSDAAERRLMAKLDDPKFTGMISEKFMKALDNPRLQGALGERLKGFVTGPQGTELMNTIGDKAVSTLKDRITNWFSGKKNELMSWADKELPGTLDKLKPYAPALLGGGALVGGAGLLASTLGGGEASAAEQAVEQPQYQQPEVRRNVGTAGGYRSGAPGMRVPGTSSAPMFSAGDVPGSN